MAKKTTPKKKSTTSELRIVHSGPSVFKVAHHVHGRIVRRCQYCGRGMTLSDVNDYGSLCEDCYMKEYY